MKRFTLFYIVFLTMTVWSCKNEENFVPYKEIEEFSILPLENTTIELAQLERLQIDPELSGIQSDKEYAYEWRLYDESDIVILSTERNLDIPVELNTGTYTFHLLVQEKNSNIKAIGELLTLRVTGAFPEGWLVGNNVNGTKGQMSFIRVRDDQVFLNPLEDINQTIYSEKLVAVISGVLPSFFYGDFSQLFYFTDNGLRVFDPQTMLQISEINEYFHRPMQFTQIPAYGTNTLHMDQFLVNAGNLHAADGLGFGMNVNFGTFSDRFEGDYDMFPFVFNDQLVTTYFYDNKNKRFMSAAYQSRELNTPSGATTNGQYNINNIQRTMLASDRTLGNNYLSLMTDDTNYYIYAFRLSSVGAIGGGYYTPLEQAPEIEELTAFAAAGNVERGYYSSTNKIYKVGAGSGTVTLLYEFPNGVEIVDLKMLKAGEDANRQLAVAINAGNEGEVYCIYLDDFGDWDTARSIKKYTGFGTITNISYRLPL